MSSENSADYGVCLGDGGATLEDHGHLLVQEEHAPQEPTDPEVFLDQGWKQVGESLGNILEESLPLLCRPGGDPVHCPSASRHQPHDILYPDGIRTQVAH